MVDEWHSVHDGEWKELLGQAKKKVGVDSVEVWIPRFGPYLCVNRLWLNEFQSPSFFSQSQVGNTPIAIQGCLLFK